MANGSIQFRGLSAYQIPDQILSNLAVRSIQATEQPTTTQRHVGKVAPSPDGAQGTGGLSCQTCPGMTFSSVEEQRGHFKTDWHRYNAKARLQGGNAISAEQWDNMVDGVSSISGSASSSSDESSGENDKVTRLLKKTKLQAVGEDSDEEAEIADRQRRAQLRTAIIWFSPSSPLESIGVPADTQFGIHRSLFPQFDHASEYLSELRRMQLAESATVDVDLDDGEGEQEQERRITLLMVAGGHFAGMVVGLRGRRATEKQNVKGGGDVVVYRHKTFHRYTTRKKQGGSQAAFETSRGRAANSAGAELRRYGEQALQEEIRALMTEWADDLAVSERIFLRASTHGKKSFWGYEGAVLSKDDDRLRVFPFPTRRPTLQELLRCWHELTRVKVSHLSAEALKEQDDAYIASLRPKTHVIRPTIPSVPAAPAVPIVVKSAEELAQEDRQRRLSEMIKKGRLDALRTFWSKNATSFSPSNVLAQAAASGQEEIIQFFLEDARLDPTLPISSDPNGHVSGDISALTEGKRAYDYCAGRSARNVFRRVAHAHPEWYDWTGAAHVPAGLGEETDAKQDARKADRRKGLRDKMRERERARAAEEDAQESEKEEEVVHVVQEPPKPSLGPQKLGGKDVSGLGGMSAEMREKIERERRARAAEERFKNLGVPR